MKLFYEVIFVIVILFRGENISLEFWVSSSFEVVEILGGVV